MKLFGRHSFFRGKSLMELTAQLKNPKGRVVTRVSFERYPEKSYYILSHVEHGYHGKNLTGVAWGTKVFRGNKYPKLIRIDAGGKRDWRLIPKDEEEEFCKIDKVHEPKIKAEDIDTRLPPVMEIVLKRNFKQRNVAFEGTPNLKEFIKLNSDLMKRIEYFNAQKDCSPKEQTS
ncbi:small ribosomal subunit protein mS34-like [Saccostrea echinata]|uniref:small ribosomal subunit protein mS34-like n=1 Tax=Saccostrea echinata TaxID=191078 RepID=UPI002A80E7CF|nr:small ribosomal subunit protein mS34-like [Saccostrea echinata]